MDKKLIDPKDVLAMSPVTAECLVKRLDEANVFLLLKGMIAIGRERPLTEEEAKTYSAAFGAVDDKSMRVYAWAMQTKKGTSMECIKAFHAATAYHIVTGVFGVPLGEAGIGHKPDMSLVPPQRSDAYYEDLVAKARAAGTIVIACDT